MPKVAVVLSGSGVYDGSELHEAILTLLHLDEAGAEIHCFAPDKEQLHVINHLKGEPSEGQSRNVLVEAARIARGQIQPLTDAKAADFDALILPGGYGAAKNLCTFAIDGANCEVDPLLRQLVLDFYRAGKPIGPMCIAPAAVAKILADEGITTTVTVGAAEDPAVEGVTAMGARAVGCRVDDIVVDEVNRIVSTPAYQLGPSIAHVSKGIRKLVQKVLEMA